MKAFKPKIIVVPHFSGTAKQTEVFKKIFTAQAEKKIKMNNTNEYKPVTDTK